MSLCVPFSAGFRRKWQRHRPQEEVGPICRPMSGLAVGGRSGCRVHREKLCVIASIQDSASDGDIDPKKRGKKGPLESPSEKDGCESALHRVVCDCMCDCLQDCPSDSDVPPKKKGKKGPSDSASEDVCESALHRVVCCDCVIVCRIAKATATSTRRRRRRRAHWTRHRTRMSCNLYIASSFVPCNPKI